MIIVTELSSAIDSILGFYVLYYGLIVLFKFFALCYIMATNCLSGLQPILQAAIPKHCDVQPQYVYESTIHSQNLLNTLNEQRKDGLLCDITVIVEGVELLAHKAVLAACSSYFSGIITDPANVSHNIVLELSSISKVGMENLLEFAYTSKLTVSKENIDHVLNAARELEMKNLEYSCLNFLKQKLFQETTESCNPGSCAESKSVCKNSTISRKLVSAPANDNDVRIAANACCIGKSSSSGDSCSTSVQSGGCPMMAQLSLEPKPPLISSQQKFVPDQGTTVLPSQALIKSLPSLCSLPKSEQTQYFPNVFQQQQQKHHDKSETVVKMMSVVSAAEPQFVCIPPDKLPMSYMQKRAELPVASKYPCPLYTSDTDEAISADEDSEKMYKCALSAGDLPCKSRKYPDVELPLSVEEITKLPRSELQELLNKHPHLSVQQISAMNEIRRRGKNRIAAQRCRKRKMDCIRALQCDLENLHKEYNDLMTERRCVRDSMAKLIEVFQQRYAQVFSDLLKPGVCELKDDIKGGGDGRDQAVVSMATFFRNEVEQGQKLVEHMSKLQCTNLPPLNLSCPVVVVCDEEEKSNFCYKPRSPGMCSSASLSSDVTDSMLDGIPMQDVTCSNTLLVQHCNAYKNESSEEVLSASSQERGSDNSPKQNSAPECDVVITISTSGS